MITREDIYRAFDDAIAIAKEWEGGPLGDKLAQFGLDIDDVREVLEERWDTYHTLYGIEVDDEPARLLFVQAMLEGLLAGTKLRPSVGVES